MFIDNPIFVGTLKYFDKHLQNKNVVEIMVNKEGEIITETNKGFQYENNEAVSKKKIDLMLRLLAHLNDQDFNVENPTVSLDSEYLIGGKKDLIRISGIFKQFSENEIALTIRKKNPVIFPKDAFFSVKAAKIPKKNNIKIDSLKKFLYGNAPIDEKIKQIILNDKTIIISGATSSGKTSCLNTVIKHFIPKQKRIVTIEDTREIMIEKHKNCLQIINRDSKNINTYLELLNITIRMRPDWLIIGEIRNKMASIFLNFASSGHPAITTLHASSPEGAIQRLADLIQLEGSAAKKEELENYIRSTIGYIIQLHRGHKRTITSTIFEIEKLFETKKQKITQLI